MKKRLRQMLQLIILLNYDGKEIILDWTRNLKITKEQYVKLTKFVELSSFEGQKVINDMEVIVGNLNMGVKPYVLFRDELMRDIQRNSSIFQTSKEKEQVRNEEIRDVKNKRRVRSINQMKI